MKETAVHAQGQSRKVKDLIEQITPPRTSNMRPRQMLAIIDMQAMGGAKLKEMRALKCQDDLLKFLYPQ